MSTALTTLTGKLAQRFDMDNNPELLDTLKATAFKGQVSDAQMTALLIVANQYGLNPWCKEIYAFPDKNNGIVPVVGVDGWSRIINEHPQLDGIEFEYGPQYKGTHHEWIECVIYRKDRSRPIRIREFWDEVSRNTGPWQTHGNRMHRHKSLIQCSRVAFGFSGIYDQDEAERIVEGTEKVVGIASGTVINGTAERVVEPQPYPADQFAKNLPAWRAAIAKGKSADQIIAMVSSKGVLSEEMKAAIRAPVSAPDMADQIKAQLEKAVDLDTLQVAADLIGEVEDPAKREELTALYQKRTDELMNG
jgi:phage recombination protein Bet